MHRKLAPQPPPPPTDSESDSDDAAALDAALEANANAAEFVEAENEVLRDSLSAQRLEVETLKRNLRRQRSRAKAARLRGGLERQSEEEHAAQSAAARARQSLAALMRTDQLFANLRAVVEERKSQCICDVQREAAEADAAQLAAAAAAAAAGSWEMLC